MGKALKIDTKQNITVVDLEEPLYTAIQKEIGGYFQEVRTNRLPENHVMLVDEEGLLKELPFNAFGSFLYGIDRHNQAIVGDILIMKTKMTVEGPDLMTLSIEEVGKLSRIFEPMINELKQTLLDSGVDLEIDYRWDKE